ncbi:pantetheine-phosphate adenylyltransferase [Streptococcus sp. H49]|uniref:pantetheine-phosphate adenylyltransferase n=1 Tax=Streptococcus huangxiaojuni TaxID=3237239 RepID=UPI0034A52C09
MSNKIGLFTGSFDPVTNGHMAIIKSAGRLFDQLYVGLFYNKNKEGFFTAAKRRAMLEEAVAGLSNVKVLAAHDSLAVDIAGQIGVTHLVRGLRNGRDLEYESELAFFNSHLAETIDTVFFLPPADLAHISSSRIRELIHFHSDVSDFVPESVVKEVEKLGEDFTSL